MAAGAGIRAGQAFVELGVKTQKLVKGLKQAGKKLKAFGGSVRNIGLKIAGLGAAMAAPFAAATKVFMSVGDQLGKMSARTGVAVESLSALEYAAAQSGTSLATVEKGLLKMSRVVQDARRGLGGAKDALAEVGLTAADLEGLSPEETFKLMAQRISEIEDPMKRAAAAQMLFGGAGKEMLPFLDQGAAGIDAMMNKAEELGLVMSAEDAAAAEKLTDSFHTLWSVMKAGMVKVGAALAPMLTKIVDGIVKVAVTVSKWIDENREWIVMAAQVIAGVIVLGGLITGLGVGIGALGFIISTVGSVIGFLVSPIGLVILAVIAIGAVIAGAITWFLFFTDTGRWMKEKLMQVFGKIAEHAELMFGGIKDALSAGEWKLAAMILWAGIKQPFISGWNWLREGWIGIKLLISQTWADLWNGVASAATKVWGWLKKRWIEVQNFFGAGIDTEVAFRQIDELTEGRLDARRADADKASRDRANKANKEMLDVQADERKNRAELRKLRKEAADKKAARDKELEEPEPIEEPDIPTALDLPKGASGFGAFSAAAVARMGQQTDKKIQHEQLEALREIAKNTEGEPGAVVFA